MRFKNFILKIQLIEFQFLQVDGLSFLWFFDDGKVLASGHILGGCACLDFFAERRSDAAHIQTWQTGHAQEIALAVVGPVVLRFRNTQTLVLGVDGATEAQECFGIAVWHEIGPIALVCVLVECQTQWTLQHVSAAVGTVLEFTAVGRIAQTIVTELVRAFLSWLSRLQFAACGAVDVDRVLAREREETDLVVEQQTVVAQFLLGHTIGAFDVGIALTGHRVATVLLLAMSIEI